MKIASVSEAKNGLSALLDVVRAGETVVIADRGIPVARLEGLSGAGGESAKIARLGRNGLVRPGTGEAPGLGELVAARPGVVEGFENAAVEAVLDDRREGR
jgi:prevent-host-death family protein